MFDSGVFSPFLGLSTDALALNFHAVLSSPGLHGGWWPPSLQSLWGLGAPESCSAPARMAGSWVLELGADQFLALDLSRQLSPARHPGEEGRACVYLSHLSQRIPTHLFYHLQPGQRPIPERDKALTSTF